MDEVWSIVIGSAIGGIILILWSFFKGRHVRRGRCPKCKTKLEKKVIKHGFVVMECPRGHGSASVTGDWYPAKK